MEMDKDSELEKSSDQDKKDQTVLSDGTKDRKDHEKSEKADGIQTQESSENTDDDGVEKYCFMCRRPKSVVGKMVHLPIGVPVCNDCMQKAFDTMRGFGGNLGNMDLSKLNTEISGLDLKNFNSLLNSKEEKTEVKKEEKSGKNKEETDIDLSNIPLPHQIKAELDAYVVGQDHAKKGYFRCCLQSL